MDDYQSTLNGFGAWYQLGESVARPVLLPVVGPLLTTESNAVTSHNIGSRSKIRIFSLGVLLSFCLTVAFGFNIAAGGMSQASAAGIGISECNNAGTVGGNTITCTITVTNNFAYNAATPNDPSGLATITTLIACTAPVVCGTTGTTTSVDPVTSITQCNASGLGRGKHGYVHRYGHQQSHRLPDRVSDWADGQPVPEPSFDNHIDLYCHPGRQ